MSGAEGLRLECVPLCDGSVSGGGAPSGCRSSLLRMSRDEIFAGLNPEQRRAVEAVRGPVCILAGAGSGKTTTITRRIANQVATDAFAPPEILAVTFTDKAAGEMRARLAALGVEGVAARTFHAAALAQLGAYGVAPEGGILPSKALILSNIARSLPRPYNFRPVGDLATEIEWAKNRRLTPRTYAEAVGDHRAPLPEDLMTRVFREYERRKTALGKIDFEDLLERAIRLFGEDDHARTDFQARFRAFTVDEYQDVNLLQQTLLELWLGSRDDLCVVGDDHQAIYSFTGATPRYLIETPTRLPHATVVRLEENYRSTPQVLALANRLVPRLGGTEKRLRAVRRDGPEPVVRGLDGSDETAWVVARIRELLGEGLAASQIAILLRTNARSAPYEEALAAARVPFQVREGGFLTRQAARRIRAALRKRETTAVAELVLTVARAEGLVSTPAKRLGEQELVRQADLARLVDLARGFDDGTRKTSDFLAHLDGRFGPNAQVDGVQLLTYHRAKGLEFEAVFLPRLEEKELPIRQAKSPEEIDEERRLLYVGMTRAKRYLHLTWSVGAPPSRFLRELGLAPAAPRRDGRAPADEELAATPAHAALRRWRLERSRADGVPAYVVFHDRTLAAIVDQRPSTRAELAAIPGIGPAKLDRYGDDVLAALAAA
jgi:DNA helicase II / ATP-dependent DNA helicase PcrA